MGETASHARRAFLMIDLPDETSQESKDPPVVALQDVRLQGDIEFERFAMSYRPDLPLILNDLSLTISEGLKVGIVGRAGAGKSSLMQALFRMVYRHRGDIRIDG